MNSPLRYQRGIALLLFLFFAIGISTTLFLSAWNSSRGRLAQDDKTRQALQQAKDALIGYAASHKKNPGYLSCPEQLSAGSPTEGQAGSNCSGTSNVLGRFPWSSLNLDKLVDGSGEPLWYAVSSGFGYSSSIGPGSLESITVDGPGNPVVAVIIAPGPPMPGQTRSRPSPTSPPLVANYLDLSNSSPGINFFVSSGAATAFNDQIMTITKADLFNALHKRLLAEMRGSLTANGVLQYYNDHGNTFPPNATPLNTLPFDTDTKKFLNPWFSLTTYTYTPPALPQLSLAGTTIVIRP